MKYELMREFEDRSIQPKVRIFLDMDGVFADFDAKVKEITGMSPAELKGSNRSNEMWRAIHAQEDLGTPFFANLPKMKDADSLMNFVKKYNPVFLTAAGKTDKYESVVKQKKEWLKRNYPNVDIITVHSGSDKFKYVDPNIPSILIDDRSKSIDPWVSAGGYGILHTSPQKTITELKQILTDIFKNTN